MSNKRTCQICGNEFDRSEMDFTRDCYGIPFRLACPTCYKKAMETGFDGQPYRAGIDENIDEDY